MKKAIPFMIAVAVGYLGLMGALLYLLPSPWNLVAALVVLLMAVRFGFTLKAASHLGERRLQK